MSWQPLLGEGRIQARQAVGEPPKPTWWHGRQIMFDHRRWVCDDAELRWTSNYHLIVLTERGRTERTLARFEGRTVFDGRDRAGSLSFVPAGVERDCAYRGADLVYSALWVAPNLHAELVQADSGPAIRGFVNGSDPVTASLLSSLGRELAAGHLPDTAYMEHATALILRRLTAMTSHRASPMRGGRLSGRLMARVEDYIEANLSNDIRLADLAVVAGLPMDAFARQFKATTGQAPYAHVIEKRVQRAETLLEHSELEIGHIAIALGFSSQSHFTATFRRLRGATPRAWRLNFRPGF